jgi:hypothetical protein
LATDFGQLAPNLPYITSILRLKTLAQHFFIIFFLKIKNKNKNDGDKDQSVNPTMSSLVPQQCLSEKSCFPNKALGIH